MKICIPFKPGFSQAFSATGLVDDYVTCSKIHHQSSFDKIIHIIWTCNTVRTWVFFTSLFLWDSVQTKIYKFDFRIRGLVVKSSLERAQVCFINAMITFTDTIISIVPFFKRFLLFNISAMTWHFKFFSL